MLHSTTIRIDKKTQKLLKELALAKGNSLQATLALAVEAYRRQLFFQELNRSVQSLKTHPAAWKAELEERKAWDVTLSDGLESEVWEERAQYNEKRKGKRRGKS